MKYPATVQMIKFIVDTYIHARKTENIHIGEYLFTILCNHVTTKKICQKYNAQFSDKNGKGCDSFDPRRPLQIVQIVMDKNYTATQRKNQNSYQWTDPFIFMDFGTSNLININHISPN